MSTRVPRTALAPQDWVEAGLQALADGGLEAIRIEVLAAGLHATKGSFYWHFADRAALVDAVLALWEQRGTEDVIARLGAIEDPLERLRVLFQLTFDSPRAGAVDVVLMAHADDARVAPVLDRVTRRRLEAMTEIVVAAGVPVEHAGHRALQAYLAWVGLLQVSASMPQVLPTGVARERFIRSVLGHLSGLLTPR